MNKRLHPTARVLILDIETRPALAYVWKNFRENVSPEQVVEPDGVLCIGYKWAGSEETRILSAWSEGTEDMLRQVAALITESDAIVGVNHKKFDLPWLMGEFARYNIPAPPKPTMIDLQQFWKRGMRFFSNKLSYVGPLLTGQGKVEHEGFMLWRRVLEGDRNAMMRMEEYCVGDVDLTEELYFKLREFLPNHPNMRQEKRADCPACGSDHVHISKYRTTKAMRIQQLHCQDCGTYFDGTRTKLTP